MEIETAPAPSVQPSGPPRVLGRVLFPPMSRLLISILCVVALVAGGLSLSAWIAASAPQPVQVAVSDLDPVPVEWVQARRSAVYAVKVIIRPFTQGTCAVHARYPYTGTWLH